MEAEQSKRKVRTSSRLSRRQKMSATEDLTGPNEIWGLEHRAVKDFTGREMDPKYRKIKEDNILTPELSNMVFGNDLIREEIFQYLLPGSCNYTMKDLVSCRQVSHSWLNYCSGLLAKLSDPVFTIDFTYWKDSREEQSKMEKRYQVQNFLDTWVTFPDADNRIPSFNLVFSKFRGDLDVSLVHDLVKCLVHCGHVLHTLELNLSKRFLIKYKQLPMDLLVAVDQMVLPKLKNLKFNLPSGAGNGMLDKLLVIPNLSGCKHLTSLLVQQKYCMDHAPWLRLFPTEVSSEYLPPSLKELEINVVMISTLLENLMLKNSLPNLTNLQLCIVRGRDEKDIITLTLNRFCQQLTCLTLRGQYRDYADEAEEDELLRLRNIETLVRFPVMTKLEYLHLDSFHFESKPGKEQHFPIVKKMIMSNQTNSMLFSLTRYCTFNCVKELTIEVAGDNYVYDDDFTLELSRQVTTAFPLVQKLDLSVAGVAENDAIHKIFECMTQLQHLSIAVVDIDDFLNGSILLGVTREYTTNLESNTDAWHLINIDEYRPRSQSIVNLSNLRMLRLNKIEREGSEDLEWEAEDLLISDVAFRFAFLCMPKLRKLSFSWGIRASKNMTKEWRGQGRKVMTNGYTY